MYAVLVKKVLVDLTKSKAEAQTIKEALEQTGLEKSDVKIEGRH